MSRTCTDWQEISCPRMGVNFTRNDFGCFAYRENQRGYKPSIVNCTLLIVNFTLFWAFRLSPSGFPLYLFPLRSKRMPLQSLTHGGCHKTNASLGLGTEHVRRRDIIYLRYFSEAERRLHKGSSSQFVGKPMAVISIVGYLPIRRFNLSLKLLFGEIAKSKFGIILKNDLPI